MSQLAPPGFASLVRAAAVAADRGAAARPQITAAAVAAARRALMGALSSAGSLVASILGTVYRARGSVTMADTTGEVETP